MSDASFKPLRRVHLRLAAATALAAGLGGGAVGVLLDDEPPGSQAAPPSDPYVAQIAPLPARRDVAAPPQPEEPPPAGRTRAPARELPPLATRWREAVLLSRRDQVLAGARALRSSPDGKQQLLALVEDPNARVRAFAMRELGRRDDPTLSPAFKRALTDPSPYVVENARWALTRLEGKR